MGFDRRRDVGQAGSFGRRAQTGPQAAAGALDQCADLRRHGIVSADDPRHGRVAVVAVDDRAGIDLDQVPFAQHDLGGRDAVDDLRVDRRAQRRGETAVALERRNGAPAAALPLGDLVELQRGDPWPDGLAEDLMQIRHHLAGPGHDLHLGGRLADDHRITRLT
jgi:hypothetical protein